MKCALILTPQEMILLSDAADYYAAAIEQNLIEEIPAPKREKKEKQISLLADKLEKIALALNHAAREGDDGNSPE